MLLALPLLAALAEPPESGARKLDEVVVRAAPLEPDIDSLLPSVLVLRGTELERRQGNGPGEVLDGLPGIRSSAFGPGASRPILRGLGGPRVLTLQDGLDSLDVASLSVDHAVALGTSGAEQIEVLKGPAALLHGSGAIGGVVNVVGKTLDPPHQPAADFAAEAGQAQQLRAASAGLSGGGDDGPRMAVHADWRQADDYRPGRGFDADRIDNSSYRSGHASATLAQDFGSLRAALRLLGHDSRYGIPGESHAGHEHDEEPDEHEAHAPVIDLRQSRADLDLAWQQTDGMLRQVQLRAAYADYRHEELEGDEVATRFDQRGHELKLTARLHAAAGGQILVGTQIRERELAVAGEEAFLPDGSTRELGLFAVYHQQWRDWHLDLGGRYERHRLDAPGVGRASLSPRNLSAGLGWQFASDQQIRLQFDRAERAPALEERYAFGPHLATRSFEIGDPDLGRERGLHGELGWRGRFGPWRLSASLFATRYRDYVDLLPTGETEDGLPVFQWTARDARFRGGEASARWRALDGETTVDVDLGIDLLRASAEGGSLPRIPPASGRLAIDLARGPWSGGLTLLARRAATRLADFETPTPGHLLVDLDLARAIAVTDGRAELFLRARNLGDRLALLHTSRLKDEAPVPGRWLSLGIRLRY